MNTQPVSSATPGSNGQPPAKKPIPDRAIDALTTKTDIGNRADIIRAFSIFDFSTKREQVSELVDLAIRNTKCPNLIGTLCNNQSLRRILRSDPSSLAPLLGDSKLSSNPFSVHVLNVWGITSRDIRDFLEKDLRPIIRNPKPIPVVQTSTPKPAPNLVPTNRQLSSKNGNHGGKQLLGGLGSASPLFSPPAKPVAAKTTASASQTSAANSGAAPKPTPLKASKPVLKPVSLPPPKSPFTSVIPSQRRESTAIGPSELDNWVVNGVRDGEVIPLMTMKKLTDTNPIAALFVGLFIPREK